MDPDERGPHIGIAITVTLRVEYLENRPKQLPMVVLDVRRCSQVSQCFRIAPRPGDPTVRQDGKLHQWVRRAIHEQPNIDVRPAFVGLLLDAKRVEFACSPALNPAFSKANARTRDAHGRRLMDYVYEDGCVERTIQWLSALVQATPAEITKAIREEPLKFSDVEKPDGSRRLIAIPTYRRRCLGNLIGTVIGLTAQESFPPCVRAYLDGDRNGVQKAIQDVAKAVHDGKLEYDAKLDLRDYFWSVPHATVLEGLGYYGFSERIIDIVAAILKTPAVRITRGTNRRVEITEGIPAGLPEAPVLANIAPFPIDEKLGKNRRLVFIRWSDDFFVGGVNRDEVVGAVNAIRAWGRSVGVRIKGVDPRMNSRKLVKDVRAERIVLLGAEIDQHGWIHMPKKTANEKLDRLKHMREHEALGEVRGLSLYAGGRGVEEFDDEDRWKLVDGTERYWSKLDEPGTDRFLAAARSTMSPTAIPAGSGAVWVAELWLPDGREGGGDPPSRPKSESPAQPQADRDAEASSTNQDRDPPWGDMALEGRIEEGIRIRALSSRDRKAPGEEDQEGFCEGLLSPEESDMEPFSYTDSLGDWDDEVSSLSSDAFVTGRSPDHSFYRSPSESDGSYGSLGTLEEEVEGAWDGSEEGEPPALSDAEDSRVVHLGYRIRFARKLAPMTNNPAQTLAGASRMEMDLPVLIKENYCPAKAEFIKAAGPEEFRTRAARKCQEDPPKASGQGGEEVILADDCRVIFATGCQG